MVRIFLLEYETSFQTNFIFLSKCRRGKHGISLIPLTKVIFLLEVVLMGGAHPRYSCRVCEYDLCD